MFVVNYRRSMPYRFCPSVARGNDISVNMLLATREPEEDLSTFVMDTPEHVNFVYNVSSPKKQTSTSMSCVYFYNVSSPKKQTSTGMCVTF